MWETSSGESLFVSIKIIIKITIMKKLLLVVSLCLLLAPAFTFASIDNNLYYGLQKNSDVKQLQEFLIDKSFLTGSSTGNFFSLTLKAVKAYQASEGINSTGYVGTLTRTAINNDLATQLSASNAEATTETGTTPPTPTPPATTNDVIATLQSQIALLTQQLQAILAQQTTTQQLQQTVQQQAQTIQQIQQNTQQIAQNTTPTIPTTPTPLSVSCSVSPNPVVSGNSAVFTALVSGGTGVYNYIWSGVYSNSLAGCTNQNCPTSCFGSACSASGNMGKATVKVSDNGNQTRTATCDDLIILPPPAPIVKGCMDSTAVNYNTNATDSDGNCKYASLKEEIKFYSNVKYTVFTAVNDNFTINEMVTKPNCSGVSQKVAHFIYINQNGESMSGFDRGFECDSIGLDIVPIKPPQCESGGTFLNDQGGNPIIIQDGQGLKMPSGENLNNGCGWKIIYMKATGKNSGKIITLP